MSNIKIWLLDPSCDNIVVKNFPKKHKLEDIYDLLDCDFVEYQGFPDDEGNSYGIYMDEEGLYKNIPFNKCASKLLGKIKGVVWGTFTGKFMIYKYNIKKKQQEYQDMDISPKEFVDKYNQALQARFLK